MSNHTPGPHFIEPYPYPGEPNLSGEYAIKSADGQLLAVLDVAGRPHAAVQADAFLFHAAPDLLDALKTLCSWLPESFLGDLNPKKPGPPDAYQKALDAIAKAEGRG